MITIGVSSTVERASFTPKVGGLVFGEEGGGGEAVFGGVAVADVLLSGNVHEGPRGWTDADDAAWTNPFDNQIGLKPNLDSTAAEWHFAL
jgi:hypothetical protein